MKYIRPDYIKDIPEEFQEYFSKDKFKNKPYPVTIEQANNYLLYDVFDAKSHEPILVPKQNKKGELTGKFKEYTHKKYYEIFNYNNWKLLDKTQKIKALYWFYEDTCEELKIWKPDFYFIRPLPPNYGGYYQAEEHCFVFNLKLDSYDEDNKITNNISAYETLDTIAHELKHAQFETTKKKDYFRKINHELYFPMPQPENYDFNDDYERFCYIYDNAFYHFQPNELDAYNYGLKKAKAVFDETNYIRLEDGSRKVKDSSSLIDLRYFRFAAKDRLSDIETMKLIVGGKEFTKKIDMANLLNEFLIDLEYVTEIILENDPQAIVDEQNADIKLTENANITAKNAYQQFLSTKKDINILMDDIEKDKEKMFKQYREYISQVKIEDLEDIYTK